jgi:hypothetical protein
LWLQRDAWHQPGILHYLVILTDIGHYVQAARLPRRVVRMPRMHRGSSRCSDRLVYCGAGGQG